MTQRVNDWPKQLSSAIETAKNKHFVWGVHDCLLFCADVILSLTGFDYASSYRGKYTSLDEAKTVVAQDYPSFDAMLDDKFTAVAPRSAQRGDIIKTSDSYGICDGYYSFFAGIDGLKCCKTSSGQKAWRV